MYVSVLIIYVPGLCLDFDCQLDLFCFLLSGWNWVFDFEKELMSNSSFFSHLNKQLHVNSCLKYIFHSFVIFLFSSSLIVIVWFTFSKGSLLLELVFTSRHFYDENELQKTIKNAFESNVMDEWEIILEKFSFRALNSEYITKTLYFNFFFSEMGLLSRLDEYSEVHEQQKYTQQYDK